MKPITLFFSWAALLLSSAAPLSHAAVLTQTLNFQPPKAVVDQTSGNNPDFSYTHLLSGWSSSDYSALSGTLKITHTGNANTGPTQELWSVFSETNLIGALGTSDGTTRTDSWVLPGGVLAAMTAGNPWQLNLYLSERTSFNSERLDLLRSELNVEYETKNKPALPAPSVPEPGTGFLCFFGIAAALFSNGAFRKASKAKETY